MNTFTNWFALPAEIQYAIVRSPVLEIEDLCSLRLISDLESICLPFEGIIELLMVSKPMAVIESMMDIYGSFKDHGFVKSAIALSENFFIRFVNYLNIFTHLYTICKKGCRYTRVNIMLPPLSEIQTRTLGSGSYKLNFSVELVYKYTMSIYKINMKQPVLNISADFMSFDIEVIEKLLPKCGVSAAYNLTYNYFKWLKSSHSYYSPLRKEANGEFLLPLMYATTSHNEKKLLDILRILKSCVRDLTSEELVELKERRYDATTNKLGKYHTDKLFCKVFYLMVCPDHEFENYEDCEDTCVAANALMAAIDVLRIEISDSKLISAKKAVKPKTGGCIFTDCHTKLVKKISPKQYGDISKKLCSKHSRMFIASLPKLKHESKFTPCGCVTKEHMKLFSEIYEPVMKYDYHLLVNTGTIKRKLVEIISNLPKYYCGNTISNEEAMAGFFRIFESTADEIRNNFSSSNPSRWEDESDFTRSMGKLEDMMRKLKVDVSNRKKLNSVEFRSQRMLCAQTRCRYNVVSDKFKYCKHHNSTYFLDHKLFVLNSCKPLSKKVTCDIFMPTGCSKCAIRPSTFWKLCMFSNIILNDNAPSE